MVDSRESAVGSADFAVGIAKTLEGLWRCNLVNQVTVDVDEAKCHRFPHERGVSRRSFGREF